jgi:hypothetical protein
MPVHSREQAAVQIALAVCIEGIEKEEEEMLNCRAIGRMKRLSSGLSPG